jgi:prepilin-type N-terminal cleavage/methylation domain-containing protein
MKNIQKQLGFSMLELSVVILVIGILVAIGLVRLEGFQQQSHNSEATLMLNAMIKGFGVCALGADAKSECGNMALLYKTAHAKDASEGSFSKVVHKGVTIEGGFIGPDDSGHIELVSTHLHGSHTFCFHGGKHEQFSVAKVGGMAGVCGNGMAASY